MPAIQGISKRCEREWRGGRIWVAAEHGGCKVWRRGLKAEFGSGIRSKSLGFSRQRIGVRERRPNTEFGGAGYAFSALHPDSGSVSVLGFGWKGRALPRGTRGAVCPCCIFALANVDPIMRKDLSKQVCDGCKIQLISELQVLVAPGEANRRRAVISERERAVSGNSLVCRHLSSVPHQDVPPPRTSRLPLPSRLVSYWEAARSGLLAIPTPGARPACK